jgi:hypothetical protein
MTVRIAYFAPLLGTGGTQRHLQQVLSLLDPARFEATVYTLRPGGEVEDELRASGVDVRSLSVGGSLAAPGSLRAIVSTARALRRARIDVASTGISGGRRWSGRSPGGSRAGPAPAREQRSPTGDDAGAWRLRARIGRQVDTRDRQRRRASHRGRAARYALPPAPSRTHRRRRPLRRSTGRRSTRRRRP